MQDFYTNSVVMAIDCKINALPNFAYNYAHFEEKYCCTIIDITYVSVTNCVGVEPAVNSIAT